MATTEHFYTGNNSTTSFAFTFPYLSNSDVIVELDNVVKTENSSGQTNNDYTINNTNIVFNSAPGTGVAIHIYRTTNVDSAQAQYAAGSSIRAVDLNNNQTQVLYAAQEAGQLIRQSDLKDSVVNSAKIVDGSIATGDLADGLITTAKLANDSVTNAKIVALSVGTRELNNSGVTTAKLADDSVTNAKIVAGSVGTRELNNSGVTTAKIAADAITGAKIADDQINSEHYVDGSIDTAHIADSQITSAKIADGTIIAGDLASNAVTTAKITDANITTAKIADSNVTTAKIAADAVTSAKIADNSINSEHYVDGSIDTAHIADGQITTVKLNNDSVTTAKITDANVTTAKIADNAITSAKINAGAVGTSDIANDAITSAKIADDAVGSTELGDGVIDTVHVGSSQITNAKLASNAVTTAKITDANVTTAKIANDAITIGKIGCEQTTISDSDSHIPTSGAVVDYVAAQIAPLGGLEVIATEVAFPNTQPSAGVVISISDAGGVVFNGSGTSTTGRTVGGSTVTINNAPSSLNSETLVAGVGLMVSSTGSSQIYNYHKILGKEDDIKQLSDDINDFNARYRVGSSNPTSALDAGDLFFNTSTQKLLVYNATNTAWEEAQSVGNFFISTLSPAFNGSLQNFTLSNAPTNVQQVLLSINGVVQKPNSGTSTPSEGFALDGSTVKLSAAPASGSDYFAIVMGSTVNIGQPSNNTASTAVLQDDAVTTAKIAASAVTATELGANAVITSKIADDAVTAAKIGALTADVDFNDNAKARFGTGNDLAIFHNGTGSLIDNDTGSLLINTASGEVQINKSTSEYMARFIVDGGVELYHNNNKKFETTSTGATVSGLLTATSSIHTNNNLQVNSDSGKLKLGASQDLEIYHNGSHSRILDSGTGKLQLGSDTEIEILNGSFNESMAKFIPNGAVELYYNNVKQIETLSNGVRLKNGHLHLNETDNMKALFGASDDLQIYHDGTKSVIDSTTTNLDIQSSGAINIKPADAAGITAFNGGAVELYHNANKKFETTSIGVKVSASNGVDGLLVTAGSEGTVTVADERDASYKASFLMAGSGPVIRNQNTNTSDSTLAIQKGGTEICKWDGNGVYTTTKQPAFYAKNTAGNQDIGSTDTVVSFNNEIFDRTNSYNTSNSTFTAPVSGLYYFTFGCCLVSIVNNFSYFFVRPMINGNDEQLEVMMPRSNGGNHPGMTGSFIFNLNANDTVRLEARAPALSGSVGVRIRGDQRWFAGHKLS